MSKANINIRKVALKDNATLAKIIRDCFEEFDAPREGTVYSDKETDTLYQYYQNQQAIGFVAEMDEEVIGTCGLYPTKGLPEGTAELVKFYIKKSGRGQGAGKMLMEECIKAAPSFNYQSLYIESLALFSQAISLYEKMGFKKLHKRLGETNHGSCDLFYLKKL